MRTALLVHELGRSGGMGVLAGHARALLEDHRFEPEIVVTSGGQLPADLDGVPVRPLADAGEYELAVSTWWTTALHLFELRAARRVAFLQSLEERFYPEEDFFERMGAASVLSLPVDFVVVARWMRDVLHELRPDARCRVVRNGIDKTVFAPRERPPHDGPLRVLVEGQPTLWFKGVQDAVRAVRAMSEPAALTLVAPEPATLEDIDAHRLTGGLEPAGMAELYSEHDVLVKLSRVESVALPPLEAFHVGVPAVLTPFTGHEEYAEHGVNSLITAFDDQPGTTALLDALARDRGLLARLSEGALRTAQGWPGREGSSRQFTDTLAEFAQGPAPDAAGALARLSLTERFFIETGRHHPQHVRGLLAWREHELADTRAHLDERNAYIGELERRIEDIGNERAYRLAKRLRRLMPG